MTGSWKYRLVVVLMLVGVGLVTWFMNVDVIFGIIVIVIVLAVELFWRSLMANPNLAVLKSCSDGFMEWRIRRGKLSLWAMFAHLPSFWRDKVSEVDKAAEYCRKHHSRFLKEKVKSVLALVKYNDVPLNEETPGHSLRFVEFTVHASGIGDPISYRFNYGPCFSARKHRLLTSNLYRDELP